MNFIFQEQLRLKDLESMAKDTEVVIVDDDPSFSILLKDYLIDACDITAELFENGDTFLDSYTNKDKRIIILDYDFGSKGKLNGLAILQRIRKINPTSTVIMVSGQDDIEIAIETMKCGAMDYFIKTNKTVFANIMSCILKSIELEKHKLN